MSKANGNQTEHVGALLSGYLDGELTQQQRQRVAVHCGDCAQCRGDLEELRALRERISGARLSELGEDQWREDMNDTTVQLSRGIGWLLIIAGALVAGAYLLYHFIADTGLSFIEKFIFFGIYGGLAVLLFSVLRQRLIERKTDKYKDVEI